MNDDDDDDDDDYYYLIAKDSWRKYGVRSTAESPLVKRLARKFMDA